MKKKVKWPSSEDEHIMLGTINGDSKVEEETGKDKTTRSRG